ncbi:SPOR domain-containing protein [Persephonella sp.]
MKKKYLITALVMGVAVVDIHTLHYFDSYASADVEAYKRKPVVDETVHSPAPQKLSQELYRVRMLIAQASTKEGGNLQPFETELKDQYYSLQFGLFKNRKTAEKFLEKLPEEIRADAFIYETDKGYYSVRYGLFDNYKLLKEIQKKIPISSIIVKTEASKIIAQEKKVKKVSPEEVKKIVEKKVEEKETPVEEKPAEEETSRIVPEFEEEEISLFEEEKPEIPLYKKIIGAVFFIPAYMLTHKQRGFWGKVEFSYRTEDYKDKYRKTSRRSFRQYYELNYGGYVYSPRLMSYKLNLNFTREDSTIDNSGNKSDSTVKLLGYGIEASLLKSTRFPINIFAKKTESPMWYTYFDRTSYTQRKIDSYGFFGSLRLPGSNVNYGYKHSKSKTTGLDFSEDRTSEEYLLSYGKAMKNKSLDITYKKNIDDYTQRYLTTGTYRDINQDIDNLNMNYRWKISKKSSVYANARYYSNSYSNNKNYTGNLNYLWNPSEKLNASFGMTATYSESTNYNLTFLSFNENISYVINKNWNITHNTIVFTSSGTNDQQLINTGLNLNYHKDLSDKFSVFAGTGASVQAESGNTNRVGGTVSASGGFNKRFDFLNSMFTFSASASQYNSSKNDQSTTYNVYERYSAFFTNNLQFEHNINYYYQDSKYYSADNNYSTTSYDNLETTNVLKYRKMLGWKGTMSMALGIKYYYGKNKAERFYPYGNLSVSYKFTRRLLAKLKADVHRDTYYNATYVRVSSSVDYKIRSLFVKFDIQYYGEDNDIYGKRENYVTLFKIYRVF